MKKFIIGIVLLAGGAMWLSTLLGIWDFSGLWGQPWTHYVLAATALLAGLHFLSGDWKNDWHMKSLPVPKEEGRVHCSVSFSGDSYRYNGEPFHGAKLETFCGGIRMDLRQALIDDNAEIEIHTFMGGVELFVPSDMQVFVNNHSFLGGVNNDTIANQTAGAKRLNITASNFMGGVSIKN